ncbi:MAG: Ldh family oxidoreductase, partial [SAR324 cluster bacterium]|nr:Ldh family oxidoreductase [SAR324 cluster bacterium]
GQPIDNGQFFLAIEPQMQSGGTFNETISELMASITEQDGTRLPNERRQENRQRLMREGIPIEKELFETLQAFA